MNEKQYTLRQWSEIQGGHEMTETPESQFSFIGSLNESKLFRSKNRVEGTSTRDMADVAFMNMLSLYIMSQTYDCLLYTSPSPRDKRQSRMPSSA